jgi:hypothetical protein
MSKEGDLMNLYDNGKFEEAFNLVDNENVDVSLGADYGLRYAMHLGNYDAVKELVKRGCKLSSNNYEAVRVFLEKYKTEEKPDDILEFIFSDIGIDINSETAKTILTPKRIPVGT